MYSLPLIWGHSLTACMGVGGTGASQGHPALKGAMGSGRDPARGGKGGTGGPRKGECPGVPVKGSHWGKVQGSRSRVHPARGKVSGTGPGPRKGEVREGGQRRSGSRGTGVWDGEQQVRALGPVHGQFLLLAKTDLNNTPHRRFPRRPLGHRPGRGSGQGDPSCQKNKQQQHTTTH